MRPLPLINHESGDADVEGGKKVGRKRFPHTEEFDTESFLTHPYHLIKLQVN